MVNDIDCIFADVKNRTYRMSVTKITYLVIFLLSLASCASEYHIQGSSSVSRLDGKMLFVKVPQDGGMMNVDSAEVVHGLFRMRGEIDTAMIASLYMDEQSIMPLVVERGDIEIQIDNARIMVKGTPLNEKLYDFFDWNKSDKILHIKKIPVFKINEKTLNFINTLLDENRFNIFKTIIYIFICSYNNKNIVLNKNGLPYAVRKQGAGLANLLSAIKTKAYVITYDAEGKEMDKTKLELGDDAEKSGVYEMKFTINNFGGETLVFDLSTVVMTEGVSDTKTNAGKTTVTEQAYPLTGAKITVEGVSGGTVKGTKLSVEAGQTAKVKVTVTLSDADKKYLNDSFENGI